MSEAENTEIEVVDQAAEQEAQKQEQSTEGFEISLGGSPSSEADKPKGNPMVTRIIGQRDKARDENADLKSQVSQLTQEIEVLKQTKQTPNEAPKYSDFLDEREYQQAVVEWANASKAKPKQQEANPLDVFTQFQKQQEATTALNSHYQRAEQLAEKFPDYSQAETVATGILGDALSQEIASLSDKSAELMLYFGRNPEQAKQFKHLADTDGRKAAIEIGRLESKLNIQPKSQSPKTEPDEALTGGGGGGSPTLEKFQKRLDAARAKGDGNLCIDIKKEARQAGLTLT